MTRTSELKEENIGKIRACFYQKGEWTKNALSAETGLSLAGTTNVLQYLAGEEEIVYVSDAESTGGRRSKIYRLNNDFHHIGAVMLKRRRTRYMICTQIHDLAGRCIYENTAYSKQGSLADIDKEIRDMLTYDHRIHVLTVSVPGVSGNGIIGVCDYEQLSGINLKEHIAEVFSMPCVIENDVNSACIGFSQEHPGVMNLTLIYQPDAEYSGCGILIEGRLYNGSTHAAGEVRYLPGHTHSEQDVLLQENPAGLLKEQIQALAAILNPDLIGYSSDVLKENQITLTDSEIPQENLPEIVRIDDMNSVLEKGLCAIGKKYLLRNPGRNTYTAKERENES